MTRRKHAQTAASPFSYGVAALDYFIGSEFNAKCNGVFQDWLASCSKHKEWLNEVVPTYREAFDRPGPLMGTPQTPGAKRRQTKRRLLAKQTTMLDQSSDGESSGYSRPYTRNTSRMLGTTSSFVDLSIAESPELAPLVGLERTQHSTFVQRPRTDAPPQAQVLPKPKVPDVLITRASTDVYEFRTPEDEKLRKLAKVTPPTIVQQKKRASLPSDSDSDMEVVSASPRKNKKQKVKGKEVTSTKYAYAKKSTTAVQTSPAEPPTQAEVNNTHPLTATLAVPTITTLSPQLDLASKLSEFAFKPLDSAAVESSPARDRSVSIEPDSLDASLSSHASFMSSTRKSESLSKEHDPLRSTSKRYSIRQSKQNARRTETMERLSTAARVTLMLEFSDSCILTPTQDGVDQVVNVAESTPVAGENAQDIEPATVKKREKTMPSSDVGARASLTSQSNSTSAVAPIACKPPVVPRSADPQTSPSFAAPRQPAATTQRVTRTKQRIMDARQILEGVANTKEKALESAGRNLQLHSEPRLTRSKVRHIRETMKDHVDGTNTPKRMNPQPPAGYKTPSPRHAYVASTPHAGTDVSSSTAKVARKPSTMATLVRLRNTPSFKRHHAPLAGTSKVTPLKDATAEAERRRRLLDEQQQKVLQASAKKQTLIAKRIEEQKRKREERCHKVQKAREERLKEQEERQKAKQQAQMMASQHAKKSPYKILAPVVDRERLDEDVAPPRAQQTAPSKVQPAAAPLEAQRKLNTTLNSSYRSKRSLSLNTSTNSQTYAMTPAKKPKPSTATNYNIDDLNSGDDTDDEEHPRKKIPQWAEGNTLKAALIKQYYHPPDIAWFPPIESPDLLLIFKGAKRQRYRNRTSSAQWDSPIFAPRHATALRDTGW